MASTKPIVYNVKSIVNYNVFYREVNTIKRNSIVYGYFCLYRAQPIHILTVFICLFKILLVLLLLSLLRLMFGNRNHTRTVVMTVLVFVIAYFFLHTLINNELIWFFVLCDSFVGCHCLLLCLFWFNLNSWRIALSEHTHLFSVTWCECESIIYYIANSMKTVRVFI